jgi:hypothetical protein
MCLLLGAFGPRGAAIAAASNATAAGMEYNDRLSVRTYQAAANTKNDAKHVMNTLVIRSPVQNSGGMKAAGHTLFRTSSSSSSSPPPPPLFLAFSYKQFPTSHVTAKDGITPGWFQ